MFLFQWEKDVELIPQRKKFGRDMYEFGRDMYEDQRPPFSHVSGRISYKGQSSSRTRQYTCPSTQYNTETCHHPTAVFRETCPFPRSKCT